MDLLEVYIVFGLSVVLIGGAFTLMMVLSAKRDEREKSKTPIYSERCGGRFGLISVTMPFVRLALYQDFVVISCWTRIVIEYDQIRRLEGEGILGIGIEFVTNNYEKYGQPIIWTFNKRLILHLLKEKTQDKIYVH